MQYDAIIVGGSFAGLSAAMLLARANRSVCVIDTGTPRNRFAAASHGFFGQDGAPPRDMIANAREKVAAYPSVRFVDTEATEAAADESGFAVTLSGGDRLLARKLVLAFGLEDGLPDFPGLKERWGETVLHCPYCHGYEFLNRSLGVLSIIPLSTHQGALIPEWGPTTFFLNGGEMPDEETRARLAARNVTIEVAPIVGLEGEASGLAGVRLADGRLVEIVALYLAPRTSFQSPISEQLGCALEDGPFGPVIQTDATKMTSIGLAHAAAGLHPAERFLDTLADALAHRVARVPHRAAVDGRAPVGGVLRHMRGDRDVAQLGHEVGHVPRVAPSARPRTGSGFVGAQGDTVASLQAAQPPG